MAQLRDTVLLVGPEGAVLGTAPKLAAHEPPGHLHLAFSVFLFRADGATLLQRRAAGKYHFAGVWANACCSHPAPGEALASAAAARVEEELGVRVPLAEAGSFTYRASDPTSGLVEHELDHVFVGRLEELPLAPDPEEIAELRFVAPAAISEETLGAPLAPWLVRALGLALAALSPGS